MNESIEALREKWAAVDRDRDAACTVPEDVTRLLDLRYGPDGDNVLDVYYPQGAEGLLPTIISIHGGGWFYGSKELYAPYCLGLAQKGFAVVNFSYRLAPEHKYPAALEDCCRVLSWVAENAAGYHIDLNNIFTVGDSAGGQLSFLLLTMLTNPDYAALFPFRAPEGFRVRGCGMNCGCYFLPFSRLLPPKRMGAIFEAYMPEDYMPLLPQLRAQKYVTAAFPPAHVTTGQYDYLKFMAAPLHRLLKKRGVESMLTVYGEKGDKRIGHVFHLNHALEPGKQCNEDQCAFFRAHTITKE